MRILVCGGRGYADQQFVTEVLDAFHAALGITVLIHGAAPGADTLARRWAGWRKVEEMPFPADWAEQGRAAGPIRNSRMLAEGRPDLVIAFPGGTGTADMKRKAAKVGIRVEERSRVA